ncbi:hypothetical protein SBA3_900003 [Candidatus Sulfopaludibacter sp. SbA3]|nr:hypothetical protein SBA3_900003 [Candidatus Sulfopaludibacter sp. SbA3]
MLLVTPAVLPPVKLAISPSHIPVQSDAVGAVASGNAGAGQTRDAPESHPVQSDAVGGVTPPARSLLIPAIRG